MKIIDLFRELSFGELSNLAISNSGSGQIIEEKQPQLVQYTNNALLALHTRFMLVEKQLLLEQVASITNYHLTRKYAVQTGADVDFRYIKDLPEAPFTGDLIRIISVHGSDGQCSYEYVLNDVDNQNSLFTPQPNVLQIPRPIDGLPTAVVYQASHAKLDDRIDGPDNILNQTIDIPIYLENALRLFVAYKVFSHMNGQENIVKSQEYLGAYEAACLEIEQRDLVNQTFSTSHCKLEQRGFV
ncbi:MAG: hypothetical protein EOQ44_25285 [Mesorhizobium sp.]|uniref:hypothetical protein n=1 Tax=Mesorhizobium sp. TaxID=1871066 RepID=UPI000FE6CBED|nr:hypothetical protein [Mesorhizobium sp.]RWB40457.1 MAG: hypothetical protein EOQ44_25285 [Mesorhizobium sp.]